MITPNSDLALPTELPSVFRRVPIGAEVIDGQTHFRVWAPKRKAVSVVFENGSPAVALNREEDGHFHGASPVGAGTLYQLELDGEKKLPDPASRYQPQGVHGPSEVIDSKFKWTDQSWKGVSQVGQVLYELHIGTFTREGTWSAATQKLQHLKETGITCLEVMPVNEFTGNFGWGYDGVCQFAPFHLYGRPDDVRQFVDRAHALGLGVIIDLVYNHMGPDGNYLPEFSDSYFSVRHSTDWGTGINFDGPGSAGVREYFLSNARYWIHEFHFDGIRFDATQAILDDSPTHILAEITRTLRRESAPREVYIVNENEPQHTNLVRPTEQGGCGMNGLWNDDFHHTATVALTGRSEGYYSDYLGTPQELLSSAKSGYLFQGQRCVWQGKRRGTPTRSLKPSNFVNFLQNHDQIANSATAQRIHELASPAQLRAMTALLLLMPQTPMLFQGQEFASPTRFYYFADFKGDLREAVRAGRAREISQAPSAATLPMQNQLCDPAELNTFLASKLDWQAIQHPFNAQMLQMHKDLLRLRREHPLIAYAAEHGGIDGAVLSPEAFCIRYLDQTGEDDLLFVFNLGHDLSIRVPPEPLLAPPFQKRWKQLWSSEDPQYGGIGTAPLDTEEEGWQLPARSAVLLSPAPPLEAAVLTRIVNRGSAQAAHIEDDSENASPT